MRKALTLALAATFALGGAAAANEPVTHEVTIFDNDFMPPVVIAEPGDKIIFYNTDDWQHRIDAIDATWTTGNIPANNWVEVNVNNGHTQEYQLDSSLFPDENADDGEEQDMTEAGLIFEEAVENADEGEVTFEDG